MLSIESSSTSPLDTHRVINSVLTQIGFIWLLFVFADMLFKLMQTFPTHYTWTEFFINYQTGFIRRGLIGEISYRLAWLVNPMTFWVTIVGGCYLFTLRWYLDIAYGFNFITILFAILTPTLIIFPLYAPDIFGRKDVLILFTTTLIAKTSRSLLQRKVTPLTANATYAALILLYSILFLTHEIILFFIPMQLYMLGIAFHRKGQLKIALSWSISICIIVFFASYYLCGIPTSLARAHKICESWQNIIPSFPLDILLSQKNAFYYLGLTPDELGKLIWELMRPSATIEMYLAGLLLAYAPIAYLLVRYRRVLLSQKNNNTRLANIVISISLMVPYILFFSGQDYGRWIHLITFHWFIFLMFLLSANNYASTSSLIIEDSFTNYTQYYNRHQNKAVFYLLLLLLYFTSWRLTHWVPPGAYPLRGFLLTIGKILIF